MLASITAGLTVYTLIHWRSPGAHVVRNRTLAWSGLSKALQPPSRTGLPHPQLAAPHVSPSEAHKALSNALSKVTTQHLGDLLEGA